MEVGYNRRLSVAKMLSQLEDHEESHEQRIIKRLNIIIHNQIQMEENMTVLDDALVALDASVKDAAARVQTSLDALNAEIATLQAAGGGSVALQAAADKIQAEVTALAAIDPVAVVPTPTPVPVPAAALTLTSGDVSAAVGQGFVAAVTADGGTAPYTFSMSGLPAGASADANGNITGTVSVAGTTAVSVSITDSATPPATGTGSFNLVVA